MKFQHLISNTSLMVCKKFEENYLLNIGKTKWNVLTRTKLTQNFAKNTLEKKWQFYTFWNYDNNINYWLS